MNTEIKYKSIGMIHTSFVATNGMPIQPHGAKETEGIVELDIELLPGLIDVEGFSHLILLYHFHQVKGHKLSVVPFMDKQPHGIFATRSPVRPNPIGISIVKLKRVEENLIYFEGADMLNGTPLIDIKPFFVKYDNRPDAVSGWLDQQKGIDITKIKADERFNS
ncbi:MAG: tRNA (N6-threonylcarbamoyladenosine(37)-N6)-methyltransferase TrmO [Prolixibacteraceae bacterium]